MIVQNLAEYIDLNALRRRERVALIEGERQLTYPELAQAMHRVGGLLQSRGVARGDVVGLSLRDGIDHMVAMLAILRIGAVLLPMDARWTAAERAGAATRFGARLVVTDAPEGCDPEAAELLVFAPEAYACDRPVALPADFSADEPLQFSLSSGTTGRPKGPLLTHRQLMQRHYSEWLGLGFLADDVNLCATPLYFGGGRHFTLDYLMGGATVVFCPPPYKPEEVGALIARHGVTTTFLVPTLLRRVLEAPETVRRPFQALRFLICSGSALHPEERAEMMARITPNIMNFYASTEGGGVAILYADAPQAAAGSVGRPVLGAEISIADDAGHALPQGEIGHIRQRAPWLPEAFYDDPAESARVFRDGWYLPGDLGFLDAAGYLHITGRAKDMIIRGGVNIYPNEIEAVLLAHPAVGDAAVVGQPSRMFGEEVAAFVVATGPVDAAALTAHCRERLAAYKVPKLVRFLDSLPRNSAGKVLKAELSAEAAADAS